MEPYKEKKLSFRKATRIILLSLIPSVVIVSLVIAYQKYSFSKKIKDPNLNITALVEECYSKDSLGIQELSELLGLSNEENQNLYTFDFRKGEQRLIQQSFIKWAKIRPLPPQILEISYEMREPIFKVRDIENAACDSDGNLFPLYPFYKPKNLPEVYIGLFHEENWKEKMDEIKKRVQLAHEIYKDIFKDLLSSTFSLKSIDVSSLNGVFSEVIINLEEKIKNNFDYKIQPYFLRLNVQLYREGLLKFLKIKNILKNASVQDDKNCVVVDLRTPHLALFKVEQLN